MSAKHCTRKRTYLITPKQNDDVQVTRTHACLTPQRAPPCACDDMLLPATEPTAKRAPPAAPCPQRPHTPWPQEQPKLPPRRPRCHPRSPAPPAAAAADEARSACCPQPPLEQRGGWDPEEGSRTYARPNCRREGAAARRRWPGPGRRRAARAARAAAEAAAAVAAVRASAKRLAAAAERTRSACCPQPPLEHVFSYGFLSLTTDA